MVLAVCLGAYLRYNGAFIGGDTADVAAYRGHVELVRTRQNVYTAAGLYPYFPGWLHVEMSAWALSQSIKWPYWLTIRLVIIAADVLTCFALWWATTRAQGATRGRWAAALYALSPIAIIISGYHGQFDALPTLFAVLAAGFLVGANPRAVPAGVLLGIGLALKPSPALLLPLFVTAPGLGRWGRLLVGGLALGIVGLVTLPYLLVDAMAVYRNIFGYGGLNDQGLGGLLRSLWLYRANNIYLPGAFGRDLSTSTRWVAIALMAFTFFVTMRRPLALRAAAVYLAFLVVFGGVSTQYLIWPMAWLLMSDVPLVWAMLYSVGASAGAIGFYLLFWPQLILGSAIRGVTPSHAGYFVVGQAVSLATIWATYVVSVGRSFLDRWWRNPLAIAALLATFATSYTVIRQIAWLASEWLKFRP